MTITIINNDNANNNKNNNNNIYTYTWTYIRNHTRIVSQNYFQGGFLNILIWFGLSAPLTQRKILACTVADHGSLGETEHLIALFWNVLPAKGFYQITFSKSFLSLSTSSLSSFSWSPSAAAASSTTSTHLHFHICRCIDAGVQMWVKFNLYTHLLCACMQVHRSRGKNIHISTCMHAGT